MQIRCPHCRNPIEVVADDPSGDISCPSCGSCFNLARDAETAGHLGAGKMLGHFQLLNRLGQGAYGQVWKARDTELQRIVAVKIPRREYLSEAETEQFLREARAAAQLRHPNLVSVHEVGREEGRLYIASDFIDGASLDEWIEAHPLTVREAAELCAKIADGLHHAHEAGVVHRDLKPQNILLDIAGEPHVADFGLAKRDAGEITMTVEGAILGTPAYMPPEQARGEAHQANRRSDVYSLGVILYRLLTGELPFRGQRQMLIVQILNEEPPAPRKLDARIPRDVETICLKCLEKDPARRYPSAAELSADLRRWLTGHPISARPVSRTERAWRWCRRNQTVAGLSATLGLALLTGMAVTSILAVRASNETKRANIKTNEAVANAARADMKADEARRLLYAAHMNTAQSNWESAHTGWTSTQISATVELLARYAPGTPDADLRGFEWYYWDRLCRSCVLDLQVKGYACVTYSGDGQLLASSSEPCAVKLWDATSGAELLTLTGHTGEVRSVAFSPAGNRLASASFDHTVKVWDVASGTEIRTLTGHSDTVSSVAFSPDGSRLASASKDGTAKLWDTETGQSVLTLKTGATWEASVAFSPDGQSLATACADSTVKIWNVNSGDETLILQGHADPVICLKYFPDGNRVASVSKDTVKVWDLKSGQAMMTWDVATTTSASLTISPDGRRLAVASSDRTVKVWNTKDGRMAYTLKGHSAWLASACFSPDGNRLASLSGDSTLKVWHVASGQEALTLNTENLGLSLAFSADGGRLASGGTGTVNVWDTASGYQTHSLGGHVGEVVSVAFSPDMRWLVSVGDKSTAKVWEAASGQQLRTLSDPIHGIERVAFSPDGNQLASGGDDGTVTVWDFASGQQMFTLDGHKSSVNSVVFSPDGKWLASAGNDGSIKVWCARRREEFLSFDGHTDPVSCLAFSPDGNRLASSSYDQTIKIWQVPAGTLSHTLKGHGAHVFCVTFSPDGKRLASASFDGTVMVWDVATGLALLTLRGHPCQLEAVAFSPDGKRLASSGNDREVKIWDARPGTQESRAEQDALALVQSLAERWLANSQPPEDLGTEIDKLPFISEPVRARAIALAPSIWRQLVESEAIRSIRRLGTTPMLKAQVQEAVQADTTLHQAVRQRALELVRELREEPIGLNAASWKVVREQTRSAEEYALALRQAEAASRLAPDNGHFLNTLGAAQYRFGSYQQALETLTRSHELNAKPLNGQSDPADIVFLAMTRHRLGHDDDDDARTLLARLRGLLQQDAWKSLPEIDSLLHEAEQLIDPSPEPTDDP